MKHILQVLRFEYLGSIKSKSFIISTAIFMVMILLLSFLPGIIMSVQSSQQGDQDRQKPVIAVCDKAYQGNPLVKKEFENYYPDSDIELTTADTNAVSEKVDNGDYLFAVVINDPLSCTYITKNNAVFSDTMRKVQTVVKEIYQTVSLEKEGVSGDVSLKILNAQVKMNTVTTGTDQSKNYLSAYILMMVLYIAIIMYGQMVSQSVVSEKNSRAMEMLITCARPSHLMFGKVIGSGLAGLTQLVLILSTALVSINTVSKDTLPTEIMDFLNFPLATVLYALLFFVLGYFIYSFLLGALSSLASRSEDLNTLISPVMILFIAAFLIVVMAINSDSVNGTLMVVCSYIPFTAPLAMFARIVLSDVAVYEIIISVAVQLISVYLLGMLAAAIYRIGVLMYGNPPKPSEIVKMLKEQYKANKAVKESIKTK